MRQMHKVIKQYFPKLFEQMGALTDHRKRRDYQVSELITSGIAMFLLKATSRNALNNDRKQECFKSNYAKIFKRRLAHMDTVEDFLRRLPAEDLDKLKAGLVAGLVEQRVLHRFKLLGKYFTVAIDGSGINSYEENDAEQSLLSKTSKNGNTTFYRYAVEAKLVTASGLAISVGTEWVTNEPGRNFDKQDCEQRAFERLARQVKKSFPRLPVCILADGLYPNKTFMKTCKDNGWEFVVVLKDDNLKTLQQDITDVENKHRHSTECSTSKSKGKKHIHWQYEWITEQLDHGGYRVYWLKCTETVTHLDKDSKVASQKATRFVYLTSMEVDKENVRNIAGAGRMRWKIENEGFNTQKNGGYNLGHKYSRKSFSSYKNYYQCMQIAHMINQFTIHSNNITALLNTDTKLTIKHIWKQLMAWLTCCIASETDFEINNRIQVRLAG